MKVELIDSMKTKIENVLVHVDCATENRRTTPERDFPGKLVGNNYRKLFHTHVHVPFARPLKTSYPRIIAESIHSPEISLPFALMAEYQDEWIH